MDKHARIFVSGHCGLVGSAICRRLRADGYSQLITRTHKQLDLCDQRETGSFFRRHDIDYVFLAAAKVGGIFANNTEPASFLIDNLTIQTNVIRYAAEHGVKKLLFLGSSCIYPKLAPQPIREEYLMTGPLEPTNEGYAVAKIAGIKMAQCYRQQYGFNAICAMPTNLYGPRDNFDLDSSHVLPALIRKAYDAKRTSAPHLTVWGTGTPRREFMHVDDFADAALFLMEHYDQQEIINVGTGSDIAISDLAKMIANTVGYQGGIVFDASKPDGTPRKLLDVRRLTALGWKASIGLKEGIWETCEWYERQRK